jgi:DNA-binding CsgD family transcriptional regulator
MTASEALFDQTNNRVLRSVENEGADSDRFARLNDGVMELLNHVADPIFRTDPDGRLVFMNEPAKRMLRSSPELVDFGSYLDELIAQAGEDVRLPDKMGTLSTREREILTWFLRGYGTATTGRRLKVSAQTVRNHLKNTCRKLGVRSQTELRELFAELRS